MDTNFRRGTSWTGKVAWALLAAAACVNRVEHAAVPPSAADPAVAGALVIEQFLRAANTRDYTTMSRLFGTKEGPIVDRYDSRQVDQRMLALAALLEHEDYSIRGTAPVPSRGDGARRMFVRMKVRGREVDVPYTIVRSDAGGWLVEQIDLERVTGR